MEKIPDFYAVYKSELDEPAPGEISEVEKLMQEFEAHETGERKFTQRYKEIAEGTKNPFVKFLLQLIISDEEKHHAITRAMAATLKGAINWTKTEEGIQGLYDVGDDHKELLKVTEEFIKLEREGLKDTKKLAAVSKGYYHGLFALLLKAMTRDSEKHLEILKFLRQRLKKA